MPIPRIHLFELEDLNWFPAVARDLSTDYLRFMEAKVRLHEAVLPFIAAGLREGGVNRVVDLCSGGGGPIPALQAALEAEGLDVNCTLTDRFPSLETFRRIDQDSGGRVGFVAEPVDARSVPEDLVGFRTLFNGFHHFKPDDAAAILRDAATKGQPIGVFELSERALLNIVSMIFLTPLIVAIGSLFIRPSTWRRLLWTYVIPLVVLCCWWDGIVSQFRAYTPTELERLAESTGVEGYTWKAGKVRLTTMPGNLTYLIGIPISVRSADDPAAVLSEAA